MLADDCSLCRSLTINLTDITDDNVLIRADIAKREFVDLFFGEIINSLNNNFPYYEFFIQVLEHCPPALTHEYTPNGERQADILWTITWREMKEAINAVSIGNKTIIDAQDMIKIVEKYFVSLMERDFQEIDF
jgi:hypothetical protein